MANTTTTGQGPDLPNPRGYLYSQAALGTQQLGSPTTLTQFTYYQVRQHLQARITRLPNSMDYLGWIYVVPQGLLSSTNLLTIGTTGDTALPERGRPPFFDHSGFAPNLLNATLAPVTTYTLRTPLQVQRNDNTQWPRELYTFSPPLAQVLLSPAGVLTPYQADLPPRPPASYVAYNLDSQNLQLTLQYVTPSLPVALQAQWFDNPPRGYSRTIHLEFQQQNLSPIYYATGLLSQYTDLYVYIAQLINAGMLVEPNVNWITSATVPYGKVISVVPVGGSTVNLWTYVTINASLGPPSGAQTATVPNVVGVQVFQAEATCWKAQLDVGQRIYAFSNSVAAGYVIAQSLVVGAGVSLGTSIQLTVSIGPTPPAAPTTTVPLVTFPH